MLNFKIAKQLLKIAKQLLSFDMTEREWQEYHKEHPNADKRNHHIIPVSGKGHHESQHKEYMIRQKKAKIKYFTHMKHLHPNYVPMINKKEFENLLHHGEYSCISAGANPNNPQDVQNSKKPDFIKNRTESLRKDLDNLGVKYTEITGFYGGEQPSFLISHTLNAKIAEKKPSNTLLVSGNKYRNDKNIISKLNQLGKKYNQDSVAHCKNGVMQWHFTTGELKRKRIVTGIETTFDAKDLKSLGAYSEGRLSPNEYTVWSARTDNALDEDFNLKKENAIDNPYWIERKKREN